MSWSGCSKNFGFMKNVGLIIYAFSCFSIFQCKYTFSSLGALQPYSIFVDVELLVFSSALTFLWIISSISDIFMVDCCLFSLPYLSFYCNWFLSVSDLVCHKFQSFHLFNIV